MLNTLNKYLISNIYSMLKIIINYYNHYFEHLFKKIGTLYLLILTNLIY